MDWSKLKVLDMGPQTTSLQLFEHLNGSVRQLQSLRITFSPHGENHSQNQHNMRILRQFLDPIDGLSALPSSGETSSFLLSLSGQYGHSLRCPYIHVLQSYSSAKEEEYSIIASAY
jgi:hypothetical protein